MLRAGIGPVKRGPERRDRWGAGLRRAWLPLLAVVLVAPGGCYWRRYAALVDTHLSLMLGYAAKLEALAADGRGVPPDRWGELTYPLERARDFARIAAKRFPGRASLESFERAVDAYASLVADPGILSRPDAAAEIARRTAALRAAAAETRAVLERERAGRQPVSGAAAG